LENCVSERIPEKWKFGANHKIENKNGNFGNFMKISKLTKYGNLGFFLKISVFILG